MNSKTKNTILDILILVGFIFILASFNRYLLPADIS
jgi:hypothetical protein